jgi:uncharacterized phage protein (TIGR01671 family)
MKDIKFRIWHKETKQMIVLDKIWLDSEYSSLAFRSKLEEWDGIDRLPHGFNNEDNPYKEYELMQYTGLKDKNGKEIYEGDIVKWKEYKNEYPLVLTEENKIIKTKVVEFNIGEIWQGYQLDKNMEVIGNIYENPNLLSEGREI